MYKSGLLLGLMAMISGAYAICECEVEHPQNLYCNSDVVIEVEEAIRTSKTFAGDEYALQIVQIHKGSDFIEKIEKPVFLLITRKGSSCDKVNMKFGEKYLVYATKTGDSRVPLESKVCHSVKNVKKIDTAEIKHMKDYECTCSISITPGYAVLTSYFDFLLKGSDLGDINKCRSPINTKCEFKEGVCNKSLGGHCSWKVMGRC